MSNWRGTWGSGTAYAVGDSVTYGGAPYYCVTANTGHTPGSDADWAVMDSFTGPGAVVDHVAVTGTPAAGQEIVATSATAANWQTPAAGLALDSTASDIKALGTQSAGSGTTAARGDHVHPSTGVVLTSSLPLAIGSGGTGQASQQAAINSLTGSQSAGKVLRSDGTNATLASIQAGDVPTLNQDTTGKSAKADALNSATTVVNVAAATAPSNGQVLTATDSTHATWQAQAAGFANPMTTLGDVIYENSTPAAGRLAGSTSATKNFLTQTGNGTVSAAPAWGTIAAGDVPTLNQNTTGTAANVTGTVALANGGTGQTSAAAALTALTGSQTSGRYVRSDGTNSALAAIQAADVPTLNQNTSGTAASLSATLAIGSGGTNATSASTAFNNLSPMTTAGDLVYGGASGAGTRLAAGSSTQVLLGGTTPAWGAVSLTTMASGVLQAAQEPAHTGDVTNSAGSLALTVAANAVTNAKAAQMAASTIKGNNTGSTANAADLTVAQAQALLGIQTAGQTYAFAHRYAMP